MTPQDQIKALYVKLRLLSPEQRGTDYGFFSGFHQDRFVFSLLEHEYEHYVTEGLGRAPNHLVDQIERNTYAYNAIVIYRDRLVVGGTNVPPSGVEALMPFLNEWVNCVLTAPSPSGYNHLERGWGRPRSP